ncbi:hypothetical protein MBAV_002430 [Candidatus Magnetobacterium bavaricum]|uniref:Uncharacterized protein n=1 Tax=Candidatus Magnetobacterium bavaricum TaxID=29290 RepID=A0A0F3GU65_9BACT|nr:hypothetical protein MBAV_002430 [Candidatus Magnetobacterium bavaricum]
MNNSRIYLSTLNYAEKSVIAQQAGITPEALITFAKGYRTPSRVTAIKLEKATKGKIKESDFTEEIKNRIFPPSPEETL